MKPNERTIENGCADCFSWCRDGTWCSKVWRGLTASIAGSAKATGCMLYVHKITLQNMSLSNTNILFLAVSTLPTSYTIFTETFTVFDYFVLVY